MPKPVTVGDWTCSPMPARGLDEHGRAYWRARNRRQEKERGLGRLLRSEVAEVAARSLYGTPGQAHALPEDITTWGILLSAWLARCEERGRLQEGHPDRIEPGSIDTYTTIVRRLKPIIGPQRLDRDPRRVAEYLLAHSDCAPRTQRSNLRAMATAWRWAGEEGVVPERSWRVPRVIVAGPVYCDHVPTLDQALAVARHMGGWREGAILLLAETGARRQEVAQLRREDLDLVGVTTPDGVDVGFARVGIHERARKTGERWTSVRGEALAWLRAHVDDVEPDRLIWPVAPASWATLRDAIERACDALKQPRWTPKGMRKLRSTLALEANTPRLVYEAELGHRLEVGLQDYAQQRRETQAAWAARREDDAPGGGAVVPLRRRSGDRGGDK